MSRAVLLALSAAACSRSEPAASIEAPVAPPRTVPLTASPAARAAFDQAELLRLNLHEAEANALYARAVADDPDFAQGVLSLAWSASGEPRARHLQRVRELAPALPELERRWTLAQLARISHDPAALEQMREIAELAPGDWYVQVCAGEVAQAHGELALARRALERAVLLAPEAAPPYNSLAYVFAAEGDHERAAQAIARYAELSPGQPNPLDSQGEILLMAGRLDEAERAFRAALQLDPDFRAEDGLAAVQLHRGDLAGGVATLQRAYGKARGWLRHDLGSALLWSYLLAGREADALALIPELEQILAEEGHFLPAVDSLALQARVHLDSGRWAEASAALDEALALTAASSAPQAPVALRRLRATRLRAALGSGDQDAASALAEALLAQGPPDELTQLVTVWMAHQRGEIEAAQAATSALAEVEPYLSEARLLTAELLARAGRQEEATAMRQQVARTYSRSPRSVHFRRQAQLALES